MNMPGEEIDAVFENGVFRPLRPVRLPEHQRVTLVLPAQQAVTADHAPASDADDTAVAYEPLPLEGRKTIRVRLKRIGELGPVPYPVEPDAEEA
jgi:predicted DNA-binding antitoxin AbrB/MazE fold protein